jgi:hypothetical protein
MRASLLALLVPLVPLVLLLVSLLADGAGPPVQTFLSVETSRLRASSALPWRPAGELDRTKLLLRERELLSVASVPAGPLQLQMRFEAAAEFLSAHWQSLETRPLRQKRQAAAKQLWALLL